MTTAPEVIKKCKAFLVQKIWYTIVENVKKVWQTLKRMITNEMIKKTDEWKYQASIKQHLK